MTANAAKIINRKQANREQKRKNKKKQREEQREPMYRADHRWHLHALKQDIHIMKDKAPGKE